jgi:hypothetical protein
VAGTLKTLAEPFQPAADGTASLSRLACHRPEAPALVEAVVAICVE